MNEKTKKILKGVGVGSIAAGAVCLFIGGGTEGYAVEIVGGVFSAVGIVWALIKGAVE